jgi:intein/homing endonuclease
MLIKEKDLIECYKKEGKLKTYKSCMNYLRFIKRKKNESIRITSKKLKINYGAALHWTRKDRLPIAIQMINYLKEKELLPFYTNTKLARIVGMLHGDGYLFEKLNGFGFVSSDYKLLKGIEEDIKILFKLKSEIKQFRKSGDKVIIYGKESKATKPTYHLEYNSTAVCRLLFLSGVPKGKKVYKKYKVPKWIKKGNLEIKKSFLQGLFDSEMSNPTISTYGSHQNNISVARMELSKIIELEDSLKDYLLEIKGILKEFNINSRIKYSKRYADKIAYRVNIDNKLKNIKQLYSKINFYYSVERKEKAQKILNLIREKEANPRNSSRFN